MNNENRINRKSLCEDIFDDYSHVQVAGAAPSAT